MDINFSLSDSRSLPESLQNLLSQRRRQYQDWDSKPPHKLGFVILFIVVLELVLARSLYHELGVGLWSLGSFIRTALYVLLLESLVVKIADEVAQFYNKRGSWKTSFTFLNLGLYPLLLFLPITLLCWVGGEYSYLRLILFLLLILKIMGNWRESLEVAYEFNRLQSSLVLYGAIGVVLALFVLLSYISVFKLAADLLSITN